MDRLISEQAVIDAVCNVCAVEVKPSECRYRKGLFGGCKEYEAIKAIPSAEPKMGHWIMKHRNINKIEYHTGEDVLTDEIHTVKELIRYETDEPYCSECGKRADDIAQDFCGYCGVRIREDGE